MGNTLFSTYSKGENRVTSSILAVFERVGISVLSAILQRMIGDSSFQLIEFTNQVKVGKNKTIPDARIKANFDYLLETKIVVKGDLKEQLVGHLEHLNKNSKLILLTPHNTPPEVLKDVDTKSEKIIWINFDKLIDIIDNLIADKGIILNEKEIFLLSELKDFIIKENLLSDPYDERVLVIPARTAYPFYLNHHVYVCQADRTFTLSAYLAFYYESAIQLPVPRILAYCDNIDLNSFELEDIVWQKINGPKKEEFDDKVVFNFYYEKKEVIQRIKAFKVSLLKDKKLITSERNKILILTTPDDERNRNLSNVIPNDLVSPNDVTAAYVQNQRYTKTDLLNVAKYTSDLVKLTLNKLS